MTKPAHAKRGGILIFFMAAAAIVLVLLTQRAIAAQLGAVVAGLWVSTMGAVLAFVAAAVGG